jgi:hypothetical protein
LRIGIADAWKRRAGVNHTRENTRGVAKIASLPWHARCGERGGGGVKEGMREGRPLSGVVYLAVVYRYSIS